MTGRILDVSHHNRGVLPQHLKAAGIAAGWAKATEGQSFRDQLYRDHLRAFAQAGVPFGAYHFALPDASVAAQLGNWTAVVQVQGFGQLPPMLDVENSPGHEWPAGDHSAMVLELLAGLERTTGRRPLLYSNGPFIHAHLRDHRLAAYPLWLARYPSRAVNPDPARLPVPAPAGPWDHWTLWQYTSLGQLPGRAGPLDLSIPADPATIQHLLDPHQETDMTPDQFQRLIASLARLEAGQKELGKRLDALDAKVQKDLEVDLIATDEARKAHEAD
jgi:GH25 family lysozyme M1 (1,4-beta-N-acetylmuramidase)